MNENRKRRSDRPDYKSAVLIVLGFIVLGWSGVSLFGIGNGSINATREVDVVLLCRNDSVTMLSAGKINEERSPPTFPLGLTSLPQFIRPVLFLPVSLNEADRELLQTISGLGPSLSGSIVDFRNREGRIDSYDALLEIKGIGPVTLEKIKEHSLL